MVLEENIKTSGMLSSDSRQFQKLKRVNLLRRLAGRNILMAVFPFESGSGES
jgi:hypothetical protein